MVGAKCEDILCGTKHEIQSISNKEKVKLFAEQTKGQVPTVFPPRRITASPWLCFLFAYMFLFEVLAQQHQLHMEYNTNT